jgi:hypothetical protein
LPLLPLLPLFAGLLLLACALLMLLLLLVLLLWLLLGGSLLPVASLLLLLPSLLAPPAAAGWSAAAVAASANCLLPAARNLPLHRLAPLRVESPATACVAAGWGTPPGARRTHAHTGSAAGPLTMPPAPPHRHPTSPRHDRHRSHCWLTTAAAAACCCTP